MKCIMIVGVSGSGKTYTAEMLGKLLIIPFYDLDEYYWDPGWRKKEKDEFAKSIKEITAKETWIISGNFSSMEIPIWQRCDCIIWLDYSIYRCLAQSFYRSLKRIIFRTPCCNGNYETFTQLFFSRNSIIRWVLTSYKKRKIFYNQIFNNHSNKKTFLRFTSPKETNSWLEKFNF
jgi:adenylate kinase family enzyme